MRRVVCKRLRKQAAKGNGSGTTVMTIFHDIYVMVKGQSRSVQRPQRVLEGRNRMYRQLKRSYYRYKRRADACCRQAG